MRRILGIGVALLVIIVALVIWRAGYFPMTRNMLTNGTPSGDPATADPGTPDVSEQEIPPAAPVAVAPEEVAKVAHDTSALGDYDLLIADRGNNRLLEVTPDKKIIWEYHFNLPQLGLGADDSFFTDNGKSIIVNLEEYHLIQILDYATKQVTWSYGVPGVPGHEPGYLNTPDDAYKLPNGNITVADIKNCRVLEISPGRKIVRQYGQTRICRNVDGYLNKPNGDTPLPDGGVFISNIVGASLVELNAAWQPILTLPLPVRYPSDPQLTRDGNILISDYSYPGQVVELDRQGKIIWQFSGAAGDVKLNHPSLAVELPNGHIMVNDDLNHRVIIIDKATKKIIWQYGVTGKPGNAPGQLNVPDGMDIIPDPNFATTPFVASAASSAASSTGTLAPSPLYTIGQVTRHAANFIGQTLRLAGYLLGRESGYAIFSDEPGGAIGRYDLPVTGPGLDNLVSGQKYELTGRFLDQGLAASNGNPDHLELLSPPLR